eukprot:1161859-Pelagomonas_calceolata.AAC.10
MKAAAFKCGTHIKGSSQHTRARACLWGARFLRLSWCGWGHTQQASTRTSTQACLVAHVPVPGYSHNIPKKERKSTNRSLHVRVGMLDDQLASCCL